MKGGGRPGPPRLRREDTGSRRRRDAGRRRGPRPLPTNVSISQPLILSKIKPVMTLSRLYQRPTHDTPAALVNGVYARNDLALNPHSDPSGSLRRHASARVGAVYFRHDLADRSPTARVDDAVALRRSRVGARAVARTRRRGSRSRCCGSRG